MKSVVTLVLTVMLFFNSIPSYSQDKIDVLLINKNYEKALSEINSRIAKKPSPQLYLKKGRVYNQLQNYQEALSSFSEALLIDPDNIDVLSEMAEGLSILGSEPSTIGVCELFPSIKKPNTNALGNIFGILPIPDTPPSVVGTTHCAQGNAYSGISNVDSLCNPCMRIFTLPSYPAGGVALTTVAINHLLSSP